MQSIVDFTISTWKLPNKLIRYENNSLLHFNKGKDKYDSHLEMAIE